MTSSSDPATPAALDTIVTGRSDDLIEFDGAIYEEFQHYGPGPARLVFDNGVILDIEWDRDGIWRITVIDGHAHATHTPCPDPTGEDDYTNTVVVHGAHKVTYGAQEATSRH